MIEITPETYEQMNKTFAEQGLAVRIEVPTQESIDRWKSAGTREEHCSNHERP